MKSPDDLRFTIYDLRLGFLQWATMVLLIAAVFRLVALQEVPPGLSQDEVLDADIALFIRQGENALFFRHGYGHEPLYHYWSAPFAPLLGDNVLASRLSAVFPGLFLVALTMRWARREFGSITAVTAGLGLAISWWPIIFSRVGIRPITEPVVLMLAVWFWPRRPWLAGFFLGLSFYTYTGARVVFLIPLFMLVFLFFLSQWSEKWRTPTGEWLDHVMLLLQVRAAFIVLAVTLLVGLPLYLTLRADPSLDQRVGQLDGPLEALRQGDVRPILQSTAATLGVFSLTGDPRWTYTLPERPLFDPFTALLFYGGLLICLIRLRQPRYAFLLIWLVVTLLPSALSPDAPSTVRLVGAMPIVYVLPGLAVQYSLHSSRYSVRRNWVPGTAYGVLLFLNLWLTARDGFIQWPAAPETREKYQTVLWEIGRFWQAHPVERWVVADGFFEPIDADSLRRNLGFEAGVRWVQTGPEVAGAIVFPGGEGNGRLFIPEFAPPTPDLLEAAGAAQRPLFRSTFIPSFAVYELPVQPTIPQLDEPINFGGLVTLLGYKLLPVEAERPLRLMTWWHVDSALPADLSTFTHLLPNANQIVAQHDGLDAAPTTLKPGDTFIQRHLLPLPADLPPGTYELHLGLYLRQSQQRLQVTETADFISLPSIVFDGN